MVRLVQLRERKPRRVCLRRYPSYRHSSRMQGLSLAEWLLRVVDCGRRLHMDLLRVREVQVRM